ncbi:CPBP family intramembrane glutamic endopeptidase [Thermobrachium celere]|uniref:CPBP family intramembrane glutamic endopeptidase n=1 Tax=Thermobrachium celere TaxID=53422 RepID=UPI001944F062|nr:CPBP family intramembrane glutamic endopeptidase [Thermobrachium celere]GFR34194.1 hypothetical protein TCEA9_00060 [Thermobrachium celere]
MFSILNGVIYYCNRVKQEPLLIIYILLHFIITFIYKGFNLGIKSITINFLMLIFWVLIIKLITNDESNNNVFDDKHFKKHLIFTIIFLVYYYFYVKFYFLVLFVKIKMVVRNNTIFLLILNALINSLFITIPFILIALRIGYRFENMRFDLKHIKISLILIILTLIIGKINNFIFPLKLHKLIPMYFIHILINGLPEELIFRGFLLESLGKITKSNINAMIFSSLIFQLIHLPIIIAMNGSPIAVFCFYPSGLVWGYLYIRTRNIIPGVLWHTSNTLLGLIFI